MEQSNVQPTSVDGLESRPLSVAILGFEEIDQQSFRRFFQVTRSYQRRYLAATRAADIETSAILMVNFDNPAALADKAAIISKYPHIQVVAVSRGPLDEPPEHHIRGMLFAARVLNVLDKVNVETPPIPVAEKPQEPIAELKPDDPATATSPPPPILVHTEAVIPAQTAVMEPQALVITPALRPAPTLPTQDQPAWVQAAPAQVEAASVPEVVAPEQAPPAPAQAVPVVTHASGYRALVVDDSPAIQKSLEINLTTLEQIGMIDFADSGEMALEKAQALQYDLIFLDVMMPGIDGYETCTQLRKKPEYKKTPIIMVSGKTSPLDEVKGVMAGCTTYLTKPVQQEAFQKLSIRVLTWLEKQKKP